MAVMMLLSGRGSGRAARRLGTTGRERAGFVVSEYELLEGELYVYVRCSVLVGEVGR